MARRLGEILVAKGKLSNDQLQKALQAQMIWGGHLGTNLIELGYVTEDELGEVLAEAHAVRYAPYEVLQDIPNSVLGSIPKGLVEKYKIVPFRFDGKKLHLVMLTPQDLTALDEVSFATGFQLVPYVTPEIRLFQVLEKYYNIPRTKRYITLSRELSLRSSGRAAVRGDAPVPDAGGPRPSPSILDAAPRPRVEAASPAEAAAAPRTAALPAGERVLEMPAAGEEAPARALEEAPDDAGYPATPAQDWSPRGAAVRREAAPADAGPGASDLAGEPAELVPEPVEDPAAAAPGPPGIERLLRARSLAEICTALTDQAAGTFRRCAVFARSGDGFVSVAGLCAASPAWSAEGLPLPFATAAADALFGERRTYYLGPPPGGGGETEFFDKLGGGPPPNTFLAPVRLNDRIALIFYGDQIDEEVRPREADGVLGLIQQASLALDLLALKRKDSPA